MKRKQLMTAIRKAREVYVFTPWIRDDGAYVRAVKADLLDRLGGMGDDTVEFTADTRGNVLYIS